MKQKKKSRLIKRAILLAYDSLQSHLPYTIKSDKNGTRKFHRTCVKEYAEIISVLSRLY